MAIYRLLREAVFDPEQIERMTAAYEAVSNQLGLADRSDPITEIIASKVIQAARTGDLSADSICVLS